MTDLLIFDCDGVLIDSERLASACMYEALSAAGAETSLEEVFRLFTGLGYSDGAVLVREKWGITDYAVPFARMTGMLFPRFRAELVAMPGMDDLLARFAGVPKCVASNSKLDRLENSLGLLAIRSSFGPHVYSAEQVARGKPAPDLIELCLSKMDCRPERALMIDDSTHGIEAAVAAGVPAIGFVAPGDPRPARNEILREAGAKHVVTGCDELSALLETRVSHWRE